VSKKETKGGQSTEGEVCRRWGGATCECALARPRYAGGTHYEPPQFGPPGSSRGPKSTASYKDAARGAVRAQGRACRCRNMRGARRSAWEREMMAVV